MQKTNKLFEQWKLSEQGLGELNSTEEREWSSTELKNSIRSIEWDLEDLDDTVQIVEKNTNKFRIDDKEISSRKTFINDTKRKVNEMKIQVENFKFTSFKSNLNADLASPVEIRSSDTSLNPTTILFCEQKHQMGEISNSVSNIRDISYGISQELDEQAVMLDEFGTEVENAGAFVTF